MATIRTAQPRTRSPSPKPSLHADSTSQTSRDSDSIGPMAHTEIQHGTAADVGGRLEPCKETGLSTAGVSTEAALSRCSAPDGIARVSVAPAASGSVAAANDSGATDTATDVRRIARERQEAAAAAAPPKRSWTPWGSSKKKAAAAAAQAPQPGGAGHDRPVVTLQAGEDATRGRGDAFGVPGQKGSESVQQAEEAQRLAQAQNKQGNSQAAEGGLGLFRKKTNIREHAPVGPRKFGLGLGCF